MMCQTAFTGFTDSGLCMPPSKAAPKSWKIAPSFWFLNMNMPIFCCNSFEIVSGRCGSNFVAVHHQTVDQICTACLPVFVCDGIGKSGVLTKKSQNGRWPQLFSPKMCSVKPVFPEEIKKKSGCLCSKYLTAPRLCKQAGLDLLKFLHEMISIPVHLYRGLFGRPSPFWHDCLLQYVELLVRLHWGVVDGFYSTTPYLVWSHTWALVLSAMFSPTLCVSATWWSRPCTHFFFLLVSGSPLAYILHCSWAK